MKKLCKGINSSQKKKSGGTTCTRLVDELNENFRQILDGYKSSIPLDQWATFYQTLPPDLQARLTERYGL